MSNRSGLFFIRNGRVIGEGGVVLSPKREIFAEFTYVSSGEDIYKLPLLNWRKLPPAKTLRGSYATLAYPSGMGYYHWVAECLPRVRFLMSILPQLDGVFCPGRNLPFMRESIHDLGINEQKLIPLEEGDHFECEHLFVPQYAGGLAMPKWVGDFLKSVYSDRGILKNKMPTRKIYVSRSKAHHRKIINEAELIAQVMKKGYEVVQLEDLPFAEQICLFNEARVVIAAHGSGLVNVFFCQAGTKVCEIMPSRYVRPHIYHVITSQIGGHYYYACGLPEQSKKQGRGEIDGNFIVDPEVLSEIVELMES